MFPSFNPALMNLSALRNMGGGAMAPAWGGRSPVSGPYPVSPSGLPQPNPSPIATPVGPYPVQPISPMPRPGGPLGPVQGPFQGGMPGYGGGGNPQNLQNLLALLQMRRSMMEMY